MGWREGTRIRPTAEECNEMKERFTQRDRARARSHAREDGGDPVGSTRGERVGVRTDAAVDVNEGAEAAEDEAEVLPHHRSLSTLNRFPDPKNNAHGIGYSPDLGFGCGLSRDDAQDQDGRSCGAGVYRVDDAIQKPHNGGTGASQTEAWRRGTSGFALDDGDDDVYDAPNARMHGGYSLEVEGETAFALIRATVLRWRSIAAMFPPSPVPSLQHGAL